MPGPPQICVKAQYLCNHFCTQALGGEGGGSATLCCTHHGTLLQVRRGHIGWELQNGDCTVQHTDCMEQSSSLSGIVPKETKPKLLICCHYLHSSAHRYVRSGAEHAAKHSARQCQAPPRPTAAGSCMDKWVRLRKTHFFYSLSAYITLRAYSCIHYETYAI